MKKILVIAAIILSIGAVVAGKIHWDKKIEAKSTLLKANNELKTENVSNDNESKDKETSTDEISYEEIEPYTKNLPEEIVNKIEKAIQTEQPIHLVMIGSASTPVSPNGWPTLLKQELENTYGNAIFTITIKEYADHTSKDFVDKGLGKEVIALNPDVVLFEPFILADNGKVRLNERLANIESILDALFAELPELTVLLQPANPLLKATYYPNEVNKLKEFAEEKGYIYLDHWTAWPDHQTDEISPYIANNLPTEKGHKTWSEYLINYFISK